MESNVECFFVQTNDEGVFLTVNPTPAGSPPVSVGQVLDALHSQQVLEYNRLSVEEAVRNPNGSPVKIAEAPQKKRDAEISVSLYPATGWKLFCRLTPPVMPQNPARNLSRSESNRLACSMGFWRRRLLALCVKATNECFVPKGKRRKTAWKPK